MNRRNLTRAIRRTVVHHDNLINKRLSLFKHACDHGFFIVGWNEGNDFHIKKDLLFNIMK